MAFHKGPSSFLPFGSSVARERGEADRKKYNEFRIVVVAGSRPIHLVVWGRVFIILLALFTTY